MIIYNLRSRPRNRNEDNTVDLTAASDDIL